MTKHVKATSQEPTVILDPLVTEILQHDVNPAVAGREAAKEAFDGLGASIVAFVRQHLPPEQTAA